MIINSNVIHYSKINKLDTLNNKNIDIIVSLTSISIIIFCKNKILHIRFRIFPDIYLKLVHQQKKKII
jgi:hypothetical protein